MSASLGSANAATSEPAVSSSLTVISSANSVENTILAQVENSDAQIPEIPSIPSELLIPPRVSRTSSGEGQVQTGYLPAVNSNSSRFDIARLQDNIDTMRSHIGREASTLTDIQNQLTIRAHELERVREELKEYERNQLPSNRTTVPPYSASVVGGSTTGTLSDLGRKGFAPSIGMSVDMTDMEHKMRDHRAEIEDLRTRLRLTTSLCSKQETYYRDIIAELENRLKETIAGRDHVLALREAESANQLQLIHQLESALTKQQGMNSEKEEVLLSYGGKLNLLEENLRNSESALNKLAHLLNDEEKKRGRTGFYSDSITGRTPPYKVLGQSATQALQRCFHEDEGEKEVLKTKLSRVEGELTDLKQQTEKKHFELQKQHEKHLSKLEDDAKQALESVNSKNEQIEKQNTHLQDEITRQRKEHEAEAAVAESKIKSREFELEMVKRQNGDAIQLLESKCRTLEEALKGAKTELEILQAERNKLMTAVSKEQAKTIGLNEKLAKVEQLLEQEKQNHTRLGEEYKNCQDFSAEEVKRLNAEVKFYEQNLKETKEKLIAERKAEVETVRQEEREKSMERFDNILQELNKNTEQMSELKSDLDIKNNEIRDLNSENQKKKEQLEVQGKEISLVRQNVLDLAQKLEEKESDLERTKEELAQLVKKKGEMIDKLKIAETSNDKLRTQLEEREKTIDTFQQQGASLAEILEKNNRNGDSLQREREQLVQKLQETIYQVEEMKKHREILARKLKAKDKKNKELEEENEGVSKQLKAKQEELSAILDDRERIVSELKMRQREVTELRDERNTLNALLEGKDGEKEKEINQLLSRLKGSEQDLNLTRKLLKTKRDISGKAVRVAESMQKEVTCKRGEVDCLQSKLHWMKENLDSVAKDKKYLENKCKSLSADLQEVTLRKDQLEYEVQRVAEQTADHKAQVKHLEQALEKAALKYADSQAVIEKLEQDIARLKLKHSLEIKEVRRNQKNAYPVTPSDAATIFSEIFARSAAAGLRFPIVNSQAIDKTILGPSSEAEKCGQVEGLKQNEEVSGELKSLLQDMRTLISSFQGHANHAATQAQNLRTLPQTQSYDLVISNGEVACASISEGNQTDTDRRTQSKSTRKITPKITETVRKKEISSFDISTSTESELDHRKGSANRDTGLDLTAPLHSSSPKQAVASNRVKHKKEKEITELPSSLTEDSDDSNITSLLFSDHSETVSTISPQDQHYAPCLSSALSEVSPLSSGQQSTSPDSAQSIFKISPDHEQKQFWERQGIQRLNGADDGFPRSAHLQKDKENLMPQPKTLKPQSSSNESAHKRAEQMLQLLAQTGNKLTKTNKEIETLLKEQDKKIKKCRKRERKFKN